MTNFEKVGLFMKTFGQEVKSKPDFATDKINELRVNLIVEEYSLSADWDNNWRHGGNLEEVIEEAHLSAEWQLKAIIHFSKSKSERVKKNKNLKKIKLLRV